MNGFHIGEIRGIDIRVNWSVLVIGALVAASLANDILPEIAEDYSTGQYWLAGIAATIAFFAGLLAHELSHSLVALNEGVRVTSITLWLFGGVAQLADPPANPGTAMRIAAAGPAMSAALGVVGLVLATLFSGLVGATLIWFGVINFVLAAFNLLPAYPMDGGRLYHAWLWSRSGNAMEATEKASNLGLIIGGGMVALGLLEALLGGFIGGLWLVLIGLFVREAARAELRQMQIEGPLRRTTIADVMTPHPETIDAGMSVASFVDRFLTESRHASYPVVDDQDRPVGLMSLAVLRELPRPAWPDTAVGAVAVPVDRLVVASADESLTTMLPRMGPDSGQRVLVVDHGRLVGIIAPSDITRLVAVLEIVGDTRSPSGSAS